MQSKQKLNKEFSRVMGMALEEDQVQKDATMLALRDQVAHKKITVVLMTKQSGVLAGLKAIHAALTLMPGTFLIKAKRKDGDLVHEGEIVARIQANPGAILSAERSILNLMQHLSGIATQTKKYVDAIQGTKAILLDTRKTIPGLRVLEKYAVGLGGGTNHRLDLSDAMMLKENHFAISKSFESAIQILQKKKNKKLIVEVEGIGQLRRALKMGVKHILLDNFSLRLLRQAVEINLKQSRTQRASLEASGGVNIKTIRKIAETGVDYISVGALTHSVQALDMSLLVEK